MTTETKKRVRARPEDRRRQIIDEATRLFGERGFYGASIRELAHRCRLTDAGLLHYFPSKESLLLAVVEDRDHRDEEIVKAVVRLVRHNDETPQPPLRQIIDLLRVAVRHSSSQPEVLQLQVVLQAEALDGAHPAHDYFAARAAFAVKAFARGLAPYVPKPESTARLLMAFMRGLEQDWLRSGRAFDLVAEWERALAILLPLPAEQRLEDVTAPMASKLASR
jgi:AcrR family transcriptional regulator